MENTKLKLVTDYDDNPVDVTAEVNFIWNIANKLRGTYQPDKYKDVIIPMTIIRRLECALDKTKEHVEQVKAIMGEDCPEDVLFSEAGCHYFNLSKFTLGALLDDPDNLVENFKCYIDGFSSDVKEILANLEFEKQIKKMYDSDRLFSVIKDFSELNLDPEKVDSVKMGYIFEDLNRIDIVHNTILRRSKICRQYGKRDKTQQPRSNIPNSIYSGIFYQITHLQSTKYLLYRYFGKIDRNTTYPCIIRHPKFISYPNYTRISIVSSSWKCIYRFQNTVSNMIQHGSIPSSSCDEQSIIQCNYIRTMNQIPTIVPRPFGIRERGCSNIPVPGNCPRNNHHTAIFQKLDIRFISLNIQSCN